MGKEELFDSSSEMAPNRSDKTGFRTAWDQFFCHSSKNLSHDLKEMAFAGELSDCPFRSVLWKIFLGVLPPDLSSWLKISSEERDRYQKLKERYLMNGFGETNGKVLVSAENSYSSTAYRDSDLARDIQQDVNRTFPEIDFFADQRIMLMMCNILYVYAKEHLDILYKQGMHELLAIIVYVLDKDLVALKKCIKAKIRLSEKVHAALRGSHIEHDAYSIFCKLMESVKVWYEYKESSYQQFKFKFQFSSNNSQSSELEQNSPAIKRINSVWKKKFKYLDPEVYHKLLELDIQAHFFSLRWFRLLFAREIPFDEVLNLWDAILAYDTELSLIESVFCALLSLMRNEIVVGDHSSCLQWLMKHPKKMSSFQIVPWALYIADSSKYPRPLGFVDRRNWQPPKKGILDKDHAKSSTGASKMTSRSYSLTNLLSAVLGSGSSAEKPTGVSSSSTSARGSGSISGPAFNAEISGPSNNRNVNVETYQASDMRNDEVNELRAKCNFCSSKIDSYINSLEQVLNENQYVQSVDTLQNTVAGLKQVRDLLNGSIPFSDDLEEGPGMGRKHNKKFLGPSRSNGFYVEPSPTTVSNRKKSAPMERRDSKKEQRKVILNGALLAKKTIAASSVRDLNTNPNPDHTLATKDSANSVSEAKLLEEESPGRMYTQKSKSRKESTSKKLLLPDKSLSGHFSPKSPDSLSPDTVYSDTFPSPYTGFQSVPLQNHSSIAPENCERGEVLADVDFAAEKSADGGPEE